jgi:hypothetical protein
MLFNPTQADVRRFFRESWRKRRAGSPLTPLETIAADWIAEHPEYHEDLAAPDALDTRYSVETGRENPFLHLSMHLAIAEQIGIDQPPGIRAAYEALGRRLGGAHAAAHEIMECLGQTVWNAQRAGTAPDGDAYLECIRRRAAG